MRLTDEGRWVLDVEFNPGKIKTFGLWASEQEAKSFGFKLLPKTAFYRARWMPLKEIVQIIHG